MSKEKMLKVIYEKIADKTLSFGCQLKFKDKAKVSDDKKDFIGYKGLIILYKYVRFGSSSSEGYDGYKIKPNECCFSDFRSGEFKFFTKETRESKYWSPIEGETINDELVDKYFDIIGHPVMIGDVLDWMRKNKIGTCNVMTNQIDEKTFWVLGYWKDKRLPIDDQSEECISFIYNLVKDEH